MQSFGIVPPREALVGADGMPTRSWWRFFNNLFIASGGGQLPGGAVIPVTVGSSPFIYTAGYQGWMIISGGGISNLEFSRDGVTFYTIGGFRGSFPLSKGDSLRVTFPSVAPIMNFVPR